MFEKWLQKITSGRNVQTHKQPLPSLPQRKIDKTPDSPQPFGYKTGWYAIQCDSVEKVIQSLGLNCISECNWQSGISAVYNRNHILQNNIFVSPCLDGFVLVIGITHEPDRATLLNLGKLFEAFQYFATHRVSEYHQWVKIIKGRLIRAYCYVGERGEVLWDEGDITPEEIDLGFDSFVNAANQDGDWDSLSFPDEESVLQIAAAWGIDVTFEHRQYAEATGYLCTM